MLAHNLRIEFRSMSEESVIQPRDISSSLADTKSVVRAAVFPSPSDVPWETVAGERGEESPVGSPEWPTDAGGTCETEAGTEAAVEDEEVDVVVGVDEVGVSAYQSEGFTLSKILGPKRLHKKNVSEVAVDTPHLPKCEFSNL